jgi:hypothetical protein
MEVDAAESVDVQVDEPRRSDTASRTAVQPDRGNAAVGDLDVARQKLAVDERGLDSEPGHR